MISHSKRPNALFWMPESGVPCSAEEWKALKKIAGGQADVSKECLRRLFTLRLVERQAGVLCLTRSGRLKLGLAE